MPDPLSAPNLDPESSSPILEAFRTVVSSLQKNDHQLGESLTKLSERLDATERAFREELAEFGNRIYSKIDDLKDRQEDDRERRSLSLVKLWGPSVATMSLVMTFIVIVGQMALRPLATNIERVTETQKEMIATMKEERADLERRVLEEVDDVAQSFSEFREREFDALAAKVAAQQEQIAELKLNAGRRPIPIPLPLSPSSLYE